MKALTRLIDKASAARSISSFLVGSLKGHPLVVTNLLFADDTLIFYEIDPEQIFHLHLILVWFKAVYGLHINLDKSVIVPVGDVYLGILGCQSAQLPLK